MQRANIENVSRYSNWFKFSLECYHIGKPWFCSLVLEMCSKVGFDEITLVSLSPINDPSTSPTIKKYFVLEIGRGHKVQLGGFFVWFWMLIQLPVAWLYKCNPDLLLLFIPMLDLFVRFRFIRTCRLIVFYCFIIWPIKELLYIYITLNSFMTVILSS